MEKKDGGNISHWQLHHLKFPEEDRVAFESYNSEVDFDNIMMVTGTVVNEPTERWNPGDHFRSSMIIEVDRKNNTIETLNTIYHFDPKTEGQDTIFDIETGNKDMGNKVLGIFY